MSTNFPFVVIPCFSYFPLLLSLLSVIATNSVAQSPTLQDWEFWRQSFHRDLGVKNVVLNPLHQQETLNDFRSFYFNAAARGMVMVEVDHAILDLEAKHKQDQDTTALIKSIAPLWQSLIAYQAALCVKEDFVYVAMGASLSLGAGANPASRGWVYQVGERLRREQARVQVRNLSSGGKTTAHALAVQLPQALKLHPDLITFTAGFNDLQYGVPVEVTIKNTDTILKALREQSDAVVVMTGMSLSDKLPMLQIDIPKLVERRQNLVPERIAAFDAAYRRLAATYDAKLVDIGDMLPKNASNQEIDRYFSFDGVHPNNKGHDRIAEIFWRGIETALK
jgi:lysophospholipase L1-like esterase